MPHTCYPGVDPRALPVIEAAVDWHQTDDDALNTMRALTALPDTGWAMLLVLDAAQDIVDDVDAWLRWHGGEDTDLTEPEARDRLAAAERTALRFLDTHTALVAL